MNVDELRAELVKGRFSPGAYVINGLAGEGGVRTDGAYYLAEENGQWFGGSYDRGTFWPSWLFQSEDEGCTSLLSLLARTPLIRGSAESDEEYDRRRLAHVARYAEEDAVLARAAERFDGWSAPGVS